MQWVLEGAWHNAWYPVSAHKVVPSTLEDKEPRLWTSRCASESQSWLLSGTLGSLSANFLLKCPPCGTIVLREPDR